ncbi:hypothetical protein [Roseofilum capinflatum]|uniref:Glycosyltransferase family 61 protein n=1 Tax=Roseofilum capinflatum BLCC-M114 TaxID=3022440 RepID=A0ABT7B9V5_9CYAN|nr:hypothetical protein [Roseofilum capinflatum]MDJ1175384.1 hypothetical protein [Roseofilum capinflatum BLCC-M114]
MTNGTIGDHALAHQIVAPHGAGLSNLVFCSPGTQVIELFSPNYVETHYWVLSQELDLDYYYLMGEGKQPKEYQDPHWIWDNVDVNIEQFFQLINLPQKL